MDRNANRDVVYLDGVALAWRMLSWFAAGALVLTLAWTLAEDIRRRGVNGAYTPTALLFWPAFLLEFVVLAAASLASRWAAQRRYRAGILTASALVVPAASAVGGPPAWQVMGLLFGLTAAATLYVLTRPGVRRLFAENRGRYAP